MATIVNSTIRLREPFQKKVLTSGKTVGSALGFLLSEEGSPLLVRLQAEGPVCDSLDGLAEHSRIAIEQAELFNTSWDRDDKTKGYMPVVRAERLHVKETQLTQELAAAA